jgi:hypothetical protein
MGAQDQVQDDETGVAFEARARRRGDLDDFSSLIVSFVFVGPRLGRCGPTGFGGSVALSPSFSARHEIDGQDRQAVPFPE